MHTSNLIIVKPEDGETIDCAVERVMENGKDQWWDWYQIGGRWSGALDGYDPNTDPANLEVCDMCGGTGDRATWRKEPKELQHQSGCNGCLGKGKHVKWPTKWDRHAGDISTLAAITPEQYKEFGRVVADGYNAFESERYVPWDRENPFHAIDLPPLAWLQKQFADYLVVVVDSHN